MPTAAMVPMTVAMAVADAARISVFLTDSSVFRSRSSSSYQRSEKPENTARLLLSLKENTSSTTIGAKRKQKTMPL